MKFSQPVADLAVIGLGVMGKSLALNLADNGYTIAAFDLDKIKVGTALAQDKTERNQLNIEQPRLIAAENFEQLVALVKKPAVFILSVPAGEPVDAVCQALIQAGIDRDDLVVDTGNSHWQDSCNRAHQYLDKFHFFTTAVSGGEVGARFGPSLMASGSLDEWPKLEPILSAIAARVDSATGQPMVRTKPGEKIESGDSCAAYIGPMGSGHFVKMVHNGIEYADMQLICEAYDLMRFGLKMSPQQIGDTFAEWNQGPLASYLIEISAEILQKTDPETNLPLVDIILDKAGQKGTGLWTAVSSLELGSPAPSIAQAVFARALSARKEERIEAAEQFKEVAAQLADQSLELPLPAIEDALYCAKVAAYAQGFALMQQAAKENQWPLNFTEIAKIWRAGCIIRAGFLHAIAGAFKNENAPVNLMTTEYFSAELKNRHRNWRQTVSAAVTAGVPFPAMAASLNYFDSYRRETLPANLLQAQRDFFGSHSFRRVDQPESVSFHAEWQADEFVVERL